MKSDKLKLSDKQLLTITNVLKDIDYKLTTMLSHDYNLSNLDVDYLYYSSKDLNSLLSILYKIFNI